MNYVTPHVIEVYSTSGCKYCRIAKAKLTELNLPYVNIDINSEEGTVWTPVQRERIALAISTTVPQIYVSVEHVGGCTELLADVDSGVFASRLDRFGIKTTASQVNNNSFASPSSPPNIAFTPAPGEPLNSLRFQAHTPTPSSEAVNALDLSRRLQELAAILLDDFSTADGKKVNYTALLSSAQFATYVDLTCQLQHCSLEELSAFDHTEKIAFWGNLYNALIIHANCVLRDAAAGSLPLQSPKAIAARSAFFSGRTGAVYRIGGAALAAQLGAGKLAVTSSDAHSIEEYVDVTPDIIEHAILRGNRPHPSQVDAAVTAASAAEAACSPKEDVSSRFYYETLQYLPPTDRVVTSKLPLHREDFDARIHFILNCGAMSCPPIKVLRAGNKRTNVATGNVDTRDQGNVEQALHSAAAAYLGAEVRVDAESRVLYLPRLLMWYEKDFGADLRSVVARAVQWLPDTASAKDLLLKLLHSEAMFVASSVGADHSAWSVVYNPYDWSLNSK